MTNNFILKEMTNIENLTGVMFNEDNAREFKPEQLLSEIDTFLKSKGLVPYWDTYFIE